MDTITTFVPLSTWERLLQDFAQLPAGKTPRTFMQVAGYPHYENVCSNVLAFYLDPREVHGLSDLVLRSLLNALGVSDQTVSEADVSREVQTANGKFLDLLVTTPEFVLGIENKISAGLYNDLQDYADTVFEAGVNSQVPDSHHFRVLLTLRTISGADAALARQTAFVPLRYRDLIPVIRDNIGHYSAAADTKFLIYLTDFMETLEQLAGLPLDRARSQFFDRRATEIEALFGEWQRYCENRIPAVRVLLHEWPSSVCRQWVWQKTTLVHDFQTLVPEPGKLVSVDFGRGAGAWWAVVFPRTADVPYFAKEIAPKVLSGVVFEKNTREGRIQMELPPSASDAEAAAWLEQILLKVGQALGHPSPLA